MAPEHIYSGFNRYFYLSIMPEYGYENIRCEPNGDYFQYMEQELRRIGFISKKYGFGGASFIFKLLILPAIALYRLLSLTSSDTSDPLCFGYNVVATKTKNIRVNNEGNRFWWGWFLWLAYGTSLVKPRPRSSNSR